MGHLSVAGEWNELGDLGEVRLMCGLGRIICAWGTLEQRLEAKIADLRATTGDVRILGGRAKPSVARLMGELRAMISMRDRRNATALKEIAQLEGDIQRIDRFRGLVISGFVGPDPDGFACRDAKNNVVLVSIDQLDGETQRLDAIGERLLAL
ncbi:hypothetical protein PX699_09775 [Sphingobium sp. H39-3-25]|uniref:hypothetical protein n=1 Tax=Sphingobium arseniciresistens TaxID=3030834 RepID=UPI0023B8D458|nr:hypothetical protein [Sphingobium arseniciresistens]